MSRKCKGEELETYNQHFFGWNMTKEARKWINMDEAVVAMRQHLRRIQK